MSDGGFPNGVRWTPVPDLFFSKYLPDRLGPSAAKVFLHLVWRIHRRESGAPPALRATDMVADETLRRGMRLHSNRETSGLNAEADTAAPAVGDASDASPDRDAESAIRAAIEELKSEELVLSARVAGSDRPEEWIFVNSQEGRRALGEWRRGGLLLPTLPEPAGRSGVERPSVLALYEENIGVLTPMMAEELEEAEAEYSALWMADAFRIAVEHNARSWAYVKRILERWVREGREGEADPRSSETSREPDVEGPYSAFIEH